MRYASFRASIASIRARFRRVVSKNTGEDQTSECFRASETPLTEPAEVVLVRRALSKMLSYFRRAGAGVVGATVEFVEPHPSAGHPWCDGYALVTFHMVPPLSTRVARLPVQRMRFPGGMAEAIRQVRLVGLRG